LIDLILATRNQDKIREITQILKPRRFRILSHHDFPQLPPAVENGETLEENSLKKARVFYDYTKIASLADDTGLEVHALGGRPGIYSSRYAGLGATYADNVRKLLSEMENLSESDRTAVFRSVVVIIDGEGKIHRAEGRLHGRIATEPRGEGGFGYDPVFFLPPYGRTLAELPPEEKNRIGHRGVAVRKALAKWIGA
jgi:XTP/dITP diphosphohydrolase